MKKILYIFLTITLLFFTIIPAYVHAEDTATTESEETSTTEDSSSTEETALSDSLNEESDESTDNGITVWTVLLAVLGIGLFIGLAYFIVKNFNL